MSTPESSPQWAMRDSGMFLFWKREPFVVLASAVSSKPAGKMWPDAFVYVFVQNLIKIRSKPIHIALEPLNQITWLFGQKGGST